MGNALWADALGPENAPLTAIDAFSGCGGLTVGTQLAAHALGKRIEPIAAIDISESALSVYKTNYPGTRTFRTDIYDVVDFQITNCGRGPRFVYPPELRQEGLASQVDLLVGGPPCQGNSNFNNRSRRTDPRNLHYLAMPALAAAIQPTIVVIENVPDVVRGNKRVVSQARGLLEGLGYHVLECVLRAERYGVPQRRRRHFLIASRESRPTLEVALSTRTHCEVTAGEVLRSVEAGTPVSELDIPASLSPTNQRRVNYLFDNDIYDLPDEHRPDCHKDGHTYPSVYGRILPNRPAQTITGGFMSPGRGRFIHPFERRGLTLREGLKLQSFPEWYRFDMNGVLLGSRSEIAQMIGDSVPPLLAKAAATIALRTTTAAHAQAITAEEEARAC